MIEFIKCPKVKGEHPYVTRTKENILSSDITMAFAINFETAGEILTSSFCEKQNKIYVPINIKDTHMNFMRMMKIVSFVDQKLFSTRTPRNLRLNIAGNGIYGLPESQEMYNWWMGEFLEEFTGRGNSLFQIISGCTGGQTGIDQAGAIVMNRLITTVVRAPNGWMFRTKENKDISDEKQFKNRFL